jgi:hypothetical protein
MGGFSGEFAARKRLARGWGRQTRFSLFIGRVAEVSVKGSNADLLDGFPALAVALASYFNVHAPFDGLFDFFKRVNTDAVSPASDSDKDAALLHNDDRFKADATYEGVRLGDGRGDEGKDVETLGMAQKQVVGREKGAASGRGAKVGRGEVGGEDIERKTELIKGWRGKAGGRRHGTGWSGGRGARLY